MTLKPTARGPGDFARERKDGFEGHMDLREDNIISILDDVREDSMELQRRG